MKTCPIWAALIVSVVLLQTVSPVFASFENQDNIKVIGNSLPLAYLPSSEGTADVQNGASESIKSVGLEEFAAAVTTGDAARITGLFVSGYGGFYVIQPSGNDGSVSQVDGVLTQFMRPATGRVIGLLAHNDASGIWFDRFPIGSLLYVLYGDGRKEIYRLTTKERFQALVGNSPTSDFVDQSTGLTLSANQVYQKTYSGKPHLTLQTCIRQEDDLDWGRLFLLAEPVE